MAQEELQFFSDSSSHRGHKYMVVGGIVLPPHRTAQLSAEMSKLKDLARMGPKSEFKWTSYKNRQRKKAYFGLVDLFFKMISDNHLHFHTLICDFHEFDHRHEADNGSKDMFKSVNKLYF